VPAAAASSLPAGQIAATGTRFLGAFAGQTYFAAPDSAGAICLLTISAAGSLQGSSCLTPGAFAANGLQVTDPAGVSAWLVPAGWAASHGPLPAWAIVAENLLAKRA
jgi:hypothetical protein